MKHLFIAYIKKLASEISTDEAYEIQVSVLKQFLAPKTWH